jgi:hypothetical protein
LNLPQIAEDASSQDFVQHILPEIKPVMKLTDPIQVANTLVRKKTKSLIDEP